MSPKTLDRLRAELAICRPATLSPKARRHIEDAASRLLADLEIAREEAARDHEDTQGLDMTGLADAFAGEAEAQREGHRRRYRRRRGHGAWE